MKRYWFVVEHHDGVTSCTAYESRGRAFLGFKDRLIAGKNVWMQNFPRTDPET